MEPVDLETRYRNDAHFHAMVDVIFDLIAKGDWSIHELRDAILCAALRYEMIHARPVPFVVQEWFKGL